MKEFFHETRTSWPELSVYQRFEQVITIILTISVSVIVLFATWRLILTLFHSIPLILLDTTQFDIVKEIFAKVFVVLIALEFNHTLRGLIERRNGIVQVQAVVLIALLAILRKLIVIEITPNETGMILALAMLILALGGVYWALRQQEARGKKAYAGKETN